MDINYSRLEVVYLVDDRGNYIFISTSCGDYEVDRYEVQGVLDRELGKKVFTPEDKPLFDPVNKVVVHNSPWILTFFGIYGRAQMPANVVRLPQPRKLAA